MRSVPKWGEAWLRQQYEIELKSLQQIAQEQGTYVNKVKRALKYHHIPIRNIGQAQVVALKTGRAKHPTQGKPREANVKDKISKRVAEAWQKMPEQKKEELRRKASEKWDNYSDYKKDRMIHLAAKGIRRSAERGSKLERYLIYELQHAGYNVDFHALVVPNNNKMEVDILIKSFKVAIEIDGPAHYLPIYGEDRLSRRKKADSDKNGLLLAHGYTIIRVRNLVKTPSKHYMRTTFENMLRELKKIECGAVSNCVVEVNNG